jgi:hypothetical protein
VTRISNTSGSWLIQDVAVQAAACRDRAVVQTSSRCVFALAAATRTLPPLGADVDLAAFRMLSIQNWSSCADLPAGPMTALRHFCVAALTVRTW